jgi:HlyD family secretion protein
MNYATQVTSDDLAGYRSAEDVQRSRRLRIGLAILAVLLVLGYVGYRMFAGGADDAPKTQQTQTVSVALVQPQAVTRMINGTGTLAARRDMPVGVVGEGGKVERVLVEPGQWVQAGQPLAVIERSVQTQELASLTANIEVARADARLAQQDLDRARALLPNGFVSKADIDRKTASRDAAAARVNVAVAQLNQSRARVGRLDVRAPAAGLVLTRSVEPGQIVSGGSGVLFRIAQGGEMELQAKLSEADLAGLRAGARAIVTPVGADRTFDGTVWQISPVVDPQSRLGMARIALPYNAALRPGGFANVEVVAGTINAPLMPESAIQSDKQGSYVYLVNKAGKIERRSVTVGDMTQGGLPVLGGLNPGDRVVLYAGGFVNPGETVTVKVASGTR